MVRTWMILLVCVVLMVAAYFATPKAKGGGQPSAVATSTNDRFTAENEPYLRAADSANAAQADGAFAKASDLLLKCKRAGVVVDYTSDPYYVTVGPEFFTFNFDVKDGICRAIRIYRQRTGRSANFRLQDSMNHRHVGTFYDGVLEMK